MDIEQMTTPNPMDEFEKMAREILDKQYSPHDGPVDWYDNLLFDFSEALRKLGQERDAAHEEIDRWSEECDELKEVRKLLNKRIIETNRFLHESTLERDELKTKLESRHCESELMADTIVRLKSKLETAIEALENIIKHEEAGLGKEPKYCEHSGARLDD